MDVLARPSPHPCTAVLGLAALLMSAGLFAQETNFLAGGHAKFRFVGQRFGDTSLFRDVAGETALDAAAELRVNASLRHKGWSLQADYQLIALNSEFLPLGVPDDGQRWLDLTHSLHDGSRSEVLHRMDRLWLGHTGDKTTVRFGRQALSWGNGLLFSPMDLVNPFDPTTIDTEYKTGDDMLYLQYLRDNGDDVQAAWVLRRRLSDGAVDADLATAAIKYHGFAGQAEYDVLLAEDGDADVIGLGAARSIGGAVLRGDIISSKSAGDSITEALVNLSYSWTWGGRNVNGSAELYHDGRDSRYFGGMLAIEVSPLWIITPTIIANVSDSSGLVQLISQYSLSDDLSLLASFNVPLGSDGTEFRGPESGIPGRYYSFEMGVFAQLAWYF